MLNSSHLVTGYCNAYAELEVKENKVRRRSRNQRD